MLDDEETVRFVGGTVQPLDDAFARLLKNAGSWALYGYGIFLVRPSGEDRIIGTCGVFRSFRGFGVDLGFDDVPEAGWIIHREYWGQGLAKEAMQAALAWFDKVHGLQRIACLIEEGNVPSDNVARALGFVPTGTHQSEREDVNFILYERVWPGQ
jgi:RimJ/RimL family protein N-acetyltransferase